MADRKRMDGHVTPPTVAWPADGSMAAFVDLLTCLERAFHAGARWTAKPGTKEHGVPWTGPEIGGFRSVMPISWQLGAEGMDYAYNKDGTGTFLTHLLSVALQLGMEQGARQERQNIADKIRLLDVFRKHTNDEIDWLVARISPPHRG